MASVEYLDHIVARHICKRDDIFLLEEKEFYMFLLRDFIDSDLCEYIIGSIERDLFPSSIFPAVPDQDYRTSFSCNLNVMDEGVQKIDQKISELLGVPMEFGEPLQGQRYSPGQQFKYHCDAFPINSPIWSDEIKRCGQRTWTAMIWLNEKFKGGQTHFAHVGKQLSPRTGSVLIWSNMASDGDFNKASVHCGLPVEEGEKYILTKWFRSKHWSKVRC